MGYRDSIYDIFYCSNVDEDVKKTIEEKQNLSGQLQGNPLDTVTTKSVMQQITGTKNASYLSSLKPWARMWLSVQPYHIEGKTVIKKDTRRVYVMGNNIYNDYRNNKGGQTIEGTTSKIGEMPSKNKFMRHSAGITSINSSTSGNAGAVRETTVNFIVYNLGCINK